VVLFAPQLFSGRTFVLGDAPVYYPFGELSRARWLEAHERTLWNPYVFCGVASAASLADSRPQYLPDFALDAIEALYRNPAWPPLAFPLLSHLAGMLAMALLARALWQARGPGMAWAGLSWGLMTNLLVPLAYGHHAKFLAASLMPVVLLLVHALFAAPERLPALGAALGLALVLGVQCMGGHPQIVVYSDVLAAAFALERARAFRRAGHLGIAAGAAALGTILSSAVWWPALLYSAHSIRGAGVTAESVSEYSLLWRDLLTLVWPWAMGYGSPSYWGGLIKTDYPQYLGITTLALAALAWRRVSRPERSPVTFLTVAAAVGILLALGSNLGVAYGIVNALLPFGSTFRVAVMTLFLSQLGVALLSARGIEQALARERRGARPPAAVGLAVAAAAVLLIGVALAWGSLDSLYAAAMSHARPALLGPLAERTAHHAGADLALRALLLAALAAGVAVSATGRHRLAVAMMIAALALDLAPVSLPHLHKATGTEPQLRSPASSLARVAAADPRFRAMPLRGRDLYSNEWSLWRARSIGGMHGTEPEAFRDFMSHDLEGRYGAICALSVRYIDADTAAARDTSLYEPVTERGVTLPVWRVRGGLPRAYAVTDIIGSTSEDAILAAMGTPAFVPHEVGASTEAGAEGHYPGSWSTVIRWLRDDPDRLALDVMAPAPAFLVVADAFFPGWSATLDSDRVPVYRVDHLLRGVKVPAGRHRITMRYEPAGWRVATVVTRTGFAVWIALAAAWLAAAGRDRRRRSHELGAA